MMEFNQVTVTHWMNKHPISIHPSMKIDDGLQILQKLDKAELPVIERGCLIGVFRLADCLIRLNHDLSIHDPVLTVMDRTCPTAEGTIHMEDVGYVPLFIVKGVEKLLIGELSKTELLLFQKEATKALKRKEETLKWYEFIFDSAYEGLTVVDDKGVIQLFNQAYSRYVGVPKEKAIGQYAENVIENTRLPVVLKTGVPERSQAHRLQGQNLVVHRIPIWKDNEIIGAAGILVYEGVSEIYQVIQQMEKLEMERNQIKNKSAPIRIEKKLIQFEDILGGSVTLSNTKKIARKAARSKATVLLTGESGVGKEQFAKAIHNGGMMNKGNLISVNCAAIPENLLEAELFGYAKGAFTGADKEGKPGKFELANHGTLFLDEIGDMPLAMQAKILRVLQEKKVVRVGSNTEIPVNFRLIAATNKDIRKMVRNGQFREDLFYRVYVIPIYIPPLKERKEDIPTITAHKLQQLAKDYNVRGKTIDQKIMQIMNDYDWPGNIRELMNVLERLFVLTDGDHITIKDLPEYMQPLTGEQYSNTLMQKRQQQSDDVQALLDEERELIEMTLKQAKGNKSQAAKLLGISRATLYNKLSRFSAEQNR